MTPQRVLPGLAVALLVAVLTARLGRTPMFLDAVSAFELHFAVLALLLAAVALLRRRPRTAAIAALAAVAGAMGAATAFQPADRPASPGPAETLIFAQANVFHGNAALPALIEALDAIGADILVTVETPQALIDTPGALDRRYPHRHYSRGPDNQGGVAVWSRFPFAAAPPPREGANPRHVIVAIDIGGPTPLQVMGLHMDWPVLGAQAQNHADFDRFWSSLRPPIVVAGDFNAVPWSAMVRRVEDITRTEIIAGWRPTWFGGVGGRAGKLAMPGGLPLDHILVSAGIGARDVRTRALPGSDHRAVVARLTVPHTPTPPN
jgi:endonuclease/exonuclease/phosphatase (EEP) superfamily protein YafD